MSHIAYRYALKTEKSTKFRILYFIAHALILGGCVFVRLTNGLYSSPHIFDRLLVVCSLNTHVRMYAYAGTQNKMSTQPTQTQIQAHFDLAHAFKFSVETNFENCHRLSQLLRYTLVLLLFLLYLLYILHCLLFHIYTHTQGNNC